MACHSTHLQTPFAFLPRRKVVPDMMVSFLLQTEVDVPEQENHFLRNLGLISLFVFLIGFGRATSV